jgi:hypothetical protein
MKVCRLQVKLCGSIKTQECLHFLNEMFIMTMVVSLILHI